LKRRDLNRDDILNPTMGARTRRAKCGRQPRVADKPDDGRYFSYGTSMFKKLRNAVVPERGEAQEHGVIAQFDGEPRFRQRLLTLSADARDLDHVLAAHSSAANVENRPQQSKLRSRIANCVV